LQGLKRSRWWLGGLQQVVAWLGPCTKVGVWRILKRLGIKYKRGRQYVHSPDPNYDLKLAYVQAAQTLVETEPARYALLYQDELTYYRRPSLARDYGLHGSEAPKVTQGYTRNRQRRIAGSLDVIKGTFIAWQRSRFDRHNLIRYYRDLEAAYPDVEVIFLVQDNWSVHFHPDILLALADSKICLLRLPTYAPWTNPVEKVWLRLKQELLHHHDFEDDWPALQFAVQDWLDHCDQDPVDLLHYVGLFPY
jgi:hypothetical protein